MDSLWSQVSWKEMLCKKRQSFEMVLVEGIVCVESLANETILLWRILSLAINYESTIIVKFFSHYLAGSLLRTVADCSASQSRRVMTQSTRYMYCMGDVWCSLFYIVGLTV